VTAARAEPAAFDAHQLERRRRDSARTVLHRLAHPEHRRESTWQERVDTLTGVASALVRIARDPDLLHASGDEPSA